LTGGKLDDTLAQHTEVHSNYIRVHFSGGWAVQSTGRIAFEKSALLLCYPNYTLGDTYAWEQA
jgi:hypothetical protein